MKNIPKVKRRAAIASHLRKRKIGERGGTGAGGEYGLRQQQLPKRLNNNDMGHSSY